jgi:predicted nucleic acid-binding protein
LITRDKDLLDLDGQKWENAEIIKPEDFLAFFRTKD